jgi:hypothetical protein
MIPAAHTRIDRWSHMGDFSKPAVIEQRKHMCQRGATGCQAWNERIYLAAIIRFRLCRAEKQVCSLQTLHSAGPR